MKRLEQIPRNSQKAKDISEFFQIYSSILSAHLDMKTDYLILIDIIPSTYTEQRLRSYGIHIYPKYELEGVTNFGYYTIFSWDNNWEPVNPFNDGFEYKLNSKLKEN